MKLSNFKALSFDCYGTLIDWETGIISGLESLAHRSKSQLSKNEILEAHAQFESLQQLATPSKLYRDVLAVVFRRLAEQWQVPVTWRDCKEYGESVGNWVPFPDTVEALQYLKQHFKLIILSNIDNRNFASTNKLLGVDFDAVYTAEDIGSYKPADYNFEYMIGNLEMLGLEKRDLLHTAESLFHDHVPANRNGLKSCWIERRRDEKGYGATKDPGRIPAYDFHFTSLAKLVETHRREHRE